MSEETFQRIWAHYLANAKSFIEKNPELYKKAIELDKLRLQAFEQLRNQLIAQGVDVDSKMENIFNDKLDGSETDRLLYGLSSLTEFVTHVMTDKKVMEFLNTVESTEERSWIAKMIDSFFEFLTQVMDTLGISYNDKSILKDCLALSYDLSGLNVTKNLVTDKGTVMPQTVFLDKETDANHLQHTVEHIFNHKVTRTDTHLGHELKIEEQLVTGGTEFFNTTINSLYRQLQQLDNTLARPVSTDEDRERRKIGRAHV